MAEPVTEKDTASLKKVAMTAMTGKGAEVCKEHLADLCVDAVRKVLDYDEDGKVLLDTEHIKLEKKVGGSVENSELINGIVVDKERVHSQMPRRVENAKIALVDAAIEIKDTEIDAKIQITDPSQMQAFLESEERMLRGMVDKIAATGATVLFCQKGIDDMAQHFLAKKGIYAARRLKKSDMEALARATGGQIVSNIDDISSKDLGKAGLVEEVKMGDDQMTFVCDCKNPKAVTVFVRGGTEHVVDEIKRAMDDAIGDVGAAIQHGKLVGGAGAPEVELARQLSKYADSLSGREQLAVQAFASAMEAIPRTLAENAGLDPIDVIAELRAAHDAGKTWAGIDVFTGKVMDARQRGVLEPLKIKTQAVSSASEVAIMILRIDDVIAGSSKGDKGGAGGGMPPGMGGMDM